MGNEHKLTQACMGLGINMLEVSRFIKISDIPSAACWGFDKKKRENFIFINPRVIRFTLEEIQLILRHEILHYVGYRGVRGAKNVQLDNICLDIAVNKILTLAYEKEMKSLCRKIYAEESRGTILALAQPHLTANSFRDKELGEFWEDIWMKKGIPSPSALYYRLVFHLDSIREEVYTLNPFGDSSTNNGSHIILRGVPEEGEIDGDKFDGVEKNQLERIIEDGPWSSKGAFSSQVSEMFSEILVEKRAFDMGTVSDFIERLEIREKLNEVSSSIIKALDGASSCQLYPYQLTRLGVIYAACGISKIVPIFWNKRPEAKKNKVAIYIDTSPSMDEFKEEEVFLVNELKDSFPTKIYVFAGDVQEISAEDFAQGKYPSGYSTSFDVIVQHLLASDYDAGVVFTDGESSIDTSIQEEFSSNSKRLFTVYFTSNGRPTSDLDQISEQSLTVNL